MRMMQIADASRTNAFASHKIVYWYGKQKVYGLERIIEVLELG